MQRRFAHDAQHVFCIRFDNTQLISKKGIIGGVWGARQSFYAVCGGQRGATQCRFSSPCERRARPPEYVHKRGSQRTERESMHYVWRDRFSAVETAAQRDDGELVRSRSLSCTAPFARLGSPVCYSCRLGTLLQPTLLLLLLVPSPFGRAALAFFGDSQSPRKSGCSAMAFGHSEPVAADVGLLPRLLANAYFDARTRLPPQGRRVSLLFIFALYYFYTILLRMRSVHGDNSLFTWLLVCAKFSLLFSEFRLSRSSNCSFVINFIF